VVQEFSLPKMGLVIETDALEFDRTARSGQSKSIQLLNQTDEALSLDLETDSAEFGVNRRVTIKPHSSRRVNVSFTPSSTANVSANLQISSGDTHKRIELRTKSTLIPTVNFIPFFKLTSGKTSTFSFSYSGTPRVKLQGPAWINHPKSAETTRPISLSCSDLPSSGVADYLVMSSPDSDGLRLPVLAYRGSSELHFKVVKDRTLRVWNHGIRTAFVLFSAIAGAEDDIAASPAGGFIPSGKSLTFSFEGGSEVAMHSGDEVLRQIQSVLNPTSFYAAEMLEILRDELGPFEAVLGDINRRVFSHVFKDSIDVRAVSLEFEDSDEPFTVSTSLCELGDIYPGRKAQVSVWVENSTMDRVTIDLFSASDLFIFPDLIRLHPEQRYNLTIGIDVRRGAEEFDDVLTLACGDFESSIRIQGAIRSQRTDFEAEILNFGVCGVGRVARGMLKLTNRKSEDSVVSVFVDSPFSAPVPSVSVSAGCSAHLSVHFLPMQPGPYQGEIVFEPDNSRPFSVPVLGSGEYL
jgi:hypothetical protein